MFGPRFREDWATCGPLNLLGLEAAAITAKDAARVDTLMERYTGAAQPPASGTSAQLTALFTDAVFGLTTHNVARALVEGGNTQVYKYYFSYSGTRYSAVLCAQYSEYSSARCATCCCCRTGRPPSTSSHASPAFPPSSPLSSRAAATLTIFSTCSR